MKNRIAVLLFAASALPLGAQTPNEQLELAERDFQRATLERGVDGWNSFFADSGAQLQNTSRIVRGHAAIRELMGEFLASKTERLIWWPIATEVSASGDMAYTFGGSGVVSVDSTGKLGISGRGTYLTVWRKQDDGRWLVTADMGGQANPQALQRSDSAAAVEVALIETARINALTRRDRATLKSIYSPDFLGLSDGGVVLRGEILDRAFGSPDPSVKISTRDVRASAIGLTGIVTGIREVNHAGTRTMPSSFLHIYTRRDGQWVFVRGISKPIK